ncbi:MULTISPECIES: hypothetical protein [unclassified Streptomyces]|uniref:hypothetical protein n=1 Tax=Streptomyces sp. DI166 TaxID=1839783 RepID=UPI0011475EE0|nr:hypothetical protein [Streptomyces sp. DI166]
MREAEAAREAQVAPSRHTPSDHGPAPSKEETLEAAVADCLDRAQRQDYADIQRVQTQTRRGFLRRSSYEAGWPLVNTRHERQGENDSAIERTYYLLATGEFAIHHAGSVTGYSYSESSISQVTPYEILEDGGLRRDFTQVLNAVNELFTSNRFP